MGNILVQSVHVESLLNFINSLSESWVTDLFLCPDLGLDFSSTGIYTALESLNLGHIMFIIYVL